MNSLVRFWRWPLPEKKLFLLACCLTCYCFIIVYLQPGKYLKKHLGNPLPSTALPIPENTQESQAFATQVRLIIQRTMRCLPSNNKCLVYTLVCKKLLQQKNIPHTLFLGMRKLEGKLVAHAWLTCGDIDIVGCEEKTCYSVIGAFTS